MADVFISYSRKDQDFVRRLHEALAGQGRDTWVDWEGIPPTAEWMKYMRLDPKGGYLFIVDGLNTWGSNLRNGERLPAPTVDAVIYDMAFSANGAYLASVLRMKGKRAFAVQIVDPATGEEVNRWALPGRGTSVHWSPDSTELAIGFKNTLSRYDVRSGLALDTYARPENPAAESAGGHLVAVRVKDTSLLRVSSLAGGTDIVYVPLGGELKAAAFQPARLSGRNRSQHRHYMPRRASTGVSSH